MSIAETRNDVTSNLKVPLVSRGVNPGGMEGMYILPKLSKFELFLLFSACFWQFFAIIPHVDSGSILVYLFPPKGIELKVCQKSSTFNCSKNNYKKSNNFVQLNIQTT